MLTLQSLSKSFGARPILDDVTWRLPAGRTMGLVGPNGAGKTTLLRIISAEDEADHGDVIIPKGVTIGYLPQELAVEDQDASLLDTILEGRRDLIELEHELRELEGRLDEGAAIREIYGELRDRFEQGDGYVFRSHAREIAVGIGFTTDDFERPISDFSGGWQMRALLARLLFRRPDVLLLDEPTNHLDLESVEWLERFLKRYEGSVLLVSHDRFFLNALVDDIVELSRGHITVYNGNYDEYRRTKEARREELESLKARQDKEVERIEEFVERFRYKATKAAQVQSRLKQLEKLERVETMEAERSTMTLKFPQPPRLGKQVLTLNGIAKRYEDNVVYSCLDLVLGRGDKVALVGPNGAGKTTLLKIMAGELEADSGEVILGNNVRASYFAQHALEQLNPRATAMEEMLNAASVEASSRVRDLLGAFLFSGDDVNKPISVLSGGEKSRLALAKLLLDPGGLLLFDEPTNHLDIPSRQVLEEALRQFEGAVVIVSHDRFFINEVANRVVHIEGGLATDYLGNFDYYRWKREHEAEAEQGAESHDSDAPPRSLTKKEIRQAMADLRRRKSDALGDRSDRLATYEARIVELEDRMEAIQSELARPEIYENPDDVRDLNQEYKTLEQELERVMEAWEELGAEVDEIESEFRVEEDELSS